MNSEDFLHLLNNDPIELVREAGAKRERKHGKQITFSRNIFVPVTHQCRNRCGYCSFVSDDSKSWIFPGAFDQLLLEAKNNNCKEVLLTLGEKPEEKYQTTRDILRKLEFQTTVEYVNYLCEQALDYRILPHSNLGVVSYNELQMLKQTNASLGLMLETSSIRLMNEGEAHHHSPGKNPSLRIETIENAGKLNIPFTTGILIGIGETWMERIESIKVIADLAKKYNHIQEVIIQNFNPQKSTPMANYPPPKEEEILFSIALARLILPDEVSIQIPPNLNRDRVIAAINHGANDLGGISPVSIDYINPNLVWQEELDLSEELHQAGFSLVERLPVYPQYEKYLNTRIREIVEEFKANEEVSTSKD